MANHEIQKEQKRNNMENKYFIKFNMPTEKLDKLDERTLLTQIMFWAHLLDKRLSSKVKTKGEELSKKLSLLSLRIELYKKKYGEKSKAYKWAVRIKELCEKAINNENDYVYPFLNKPTIEVSQREFDNFMKSRRSIRTYNGKNVRDELIMEILEYASWAPNTCNCQALRYVVIESKEIKDKIKVIGIDIKNSACVIAVLADFRMYPEIEGAYHDSGAAIQNMLLACHYFGLGACYISGRKTNDKIHSLIPVHEYEKVTAIVSIGHYDKSPITPERIEIRNIVSSC